MKKNSILIVDDEGSNIIALTHILSPEYKIYAAINGQDAIEIAEKHQPDIIVLDIVMPEVDGYKVMASLKSAATTKNIPIIFITSLTGSKDEEKGLALGAADYITKPFRDTIVKLRIRNQIKIINQTHQLIENERLIIEKEFTEKSSLAKIEFLVRMSHEMLTPMNAIMGMTQILMMSENTKQAMERLEEIDAASKRLHRLINDLLEISGSDSSALTLTYAPFSFNTMIKDIIKRIESYSLSKKQTLTYGIDPAIPMFLNGDKGRLSQVIVNILVNAIKYTYENGKVHLLVNILEEDSESVTLQIEITDDGIGIPKDKQKEIFGIFEQTSQAREKKPGGAGLGLPISKRIVEMMGGQIQVESELGAGSRFVFTCRLNKA